MNCNSCIKINAIPSCIDSVAFRLQGITLPGSPDEVVVVRITDTATGQTTTLPVVTNGGGIITLGLDVAAIYPLMDHWYKMEFLVDGSPAKLLLTNPDATEVEGCCIEFTTFDYTATEQWQLSNIRCAV